ncbi:type I restriction modification DNA specificity domain protein [Bacteroides fragilis str. 2-F-2 |uniref:Type I restriction modification DNA specificity domain protein n=2 Tax=Bacteroidales TaxID=171549 RepID=A0A016BUG3_BACFG|nr:restriction endonuclease subunit S [Bacteroides fragilis]EXZ44226.1 type I restriction modification DNA specificity domain protein [Bacteroides fragilis str. 2-F-2 \
MADNKENKVLNVPALRFPEFTEEWNYESLDTIAPNITSGRSKPSLGEYNLYGSTGIIGKTATADYSGDMLLVARVGANAGSLQLVNDSCGITDNTLIIKSCKLSSHYLYFYLQHYNLNRLVFGSGQPLITAGMLKKVRIPFGNQLEQKKIENFLCCIDERITTQNKIIEDLKKLKSAIYQEMFGSLVAQTLKLGQVAEVVKGKQVNGTELLEQGDYYVMNGGTLPSGWLYKYNTEANTISISEGGNSCGYVQYNTSPYWSGGHCYSLKILHPQETSDLYLYHFLKWQEENIMALRIGSGLPNIQKKDLLHFPVILPTITQQNKIVLILSAIEEKVSCEISITQYFVKQKEYLLSQLFI